MLYAFVVCRCRFVDKNMLSKYLSEEDEVERFLRLAWECHGENGQTLEDARRSPLFDVGHPLSSHQGSEWVEDDETSDAGVEGDRGCAQGHQALYVSQQAKRKHHERTGPCLVKTKT